MSATSTHAKKMAKMEREQNIVNEMANKIRYLASININPSYISIVMKSKGVF